LVPEATNVRQHITRAELEVMQSDLRLDRAALLEALAAIDESLLWVDNELALRPRMRRDGAERRSIDPAEVRDYMRARGMEASPAQCAKHFDISIGQARKRLEELADAEILIRVNLDGSRERLYRYVKPIPGSPPRRLPKGGRRAKKSPVVSGIAGTGKQHRNRKKRRGAITGVKGS
jgi:hypothetical protein